MYPTLFHIGQISVNTYGLLIGIGFLLGVYLVRRESPKLSIEPRVAAILCYGWLVSGLVGSRLLHIIMYPEGYSWSHPLGWIALWRGGLVFQGAVPAVLAFHWIASRKFKVDTWRFLDLIVPYTQITHAFGRLGCFFYGCCFGPETSLPWGVRFPRWPHDLSLRAAGSPAYLDDCQRYSDFLPSVELWSHPVHPTQLYAAAFLALLCPILLKIRNRLGAGLGFALPSYLVLSSIWRFGIEFLRDDNKKFLDLVTYQQGISLLFITVGIAIFLYLRKKNAAVPQQLSLRKRST